MKLPVIIEPSFKKAYKKLDSQMQERTDKALRKLFEDASHPSLNLEKLKGHPNIYSARVTRGVRMLLRKHDGGFALIDIDKHDIYKRL